MDKYIEPCGRCGSTGLDPCNKHCAEKNVKCFDCRGRKITQYDIQLCEDCFDTKPSNSYQTDQQFTCHACDKDWYLEDTCEIDDNSFSNANSVYKCTCGVFY